MTFIPVPDAFKPYEEPPMYNVTLSRAEALLIQKIRDIKFGSIKVYLTNGKLVRTETSNSELFKDSGGDEVTISFETLIEQR